MKIPLLMPYDFSCYKMGRELPKHALTKFELMQATV